MLYYNIIVYIVYIIATAAEKGRIKIVIIHIIQCSIIIIIMNQQDGKQYTYSVLNSTVILVTVIGI